MSLGVQIVAGWMGFVALFGFALLLRASYSGQFDDVEDIKYIPFREREPEEWPGRTTASKGA